MDITQAGSIYVDLTAENTADVDVYFDDLKITHYRNKVITQTTDYYPFGSVLRRAETNEENHYRYGYQGKFSEEDEETGWNSFELRMYDPVIGGVTTIDPYRQFASPYKAMGNNPINGIDESGGFSTDPGILLFFNEVTLGFGATKGVISITQTGLAYDAAGMVTFATFVDVTVGDLNDEMEFGLSAGLMPFD